MDKIFYGYIRVSTMEQNDIRQRLGLAKWGIDEKNIFADKISGKDFNRPEYKKLRRRLKEGDTLVVKSLDRLGRNYIEIQEEWRHLVKKVKADIVIVDMPLLDTRTNRDLIGTLISDIVLQLLSYVAQAERENIRERQAEGIAAAKARGVRFGRESAPYPKNFEKVYFKCKRGEITKRQAIAALGITENQYRWVCSRWIAENRSPTSKEISDS